MLINILLVPTDGTSVVFAFSLSSYDRWSSFIAVVVVFGVSLRVSFFIDVGCPSDVGIRSGCLMSFVLLGGQSADLWSVTTCERQMSRHHLLDLWDSTRIFLTNSTSSISVTYKCIEVCEHQFRPQYSQSVKSFILFCQMFGGHQSFKWSHWRPYFRHPGHPR